MMNTNILFMSLVFLFTSVTANKVPMKSDNFGPYSLTLKQYDTCKGPKVNNAADFSTNVTIRGSKIMRYYNFVFPEDTSIDEIIVLVYSLSANEKKMLYNYKMTDPCHHNFTAVFIKPLFKTSNCVVSKGTYIFMLNTEETAKSYLGPKFFYGDYVFKANMLSKQGNLMCLIVEYEISKKNV